jgi:hypothetical protein
MTTSSESRLDQAIIDSSYGARSETSPVIPCEAARRHPAIATGGLMRSNRRPAGLADDLALNPMFTQDVEQGPVPRDRFPRRGMLPATA